MNLNRQRGIAQLVVVAVMAFLVLGLPLTTKLVQQSQENRSQATSTGIPTPATSVSYKCEQDITGYWWSNQYINGIQQPGQIKCTSGTCEDGKCTSLSNIPLEQQIVKYECRKAAQYPYYVNAIKTEWFSVGLDASGKEITSQQCPINTSCANGKCTNLNVSNPDTVAVTYMCNGEYSEKLVSGRQEGSGTKCIKGCNATNGRCNTGYGCEHDNMAGNDWSNYYDQDNNKSQQTNCTTAGCDIFTGKCNKVGVKVKYVCKFVTNESWSRGLDTSGKEVTSTKCSCATCCNATTGKCAAPTDMTITYKCDGTDSEKLVSGRQEGSGTKCIKGCNATNGRCNTGYGCEHDNMAGNDWSNYYDQDNNKSQQTNCTTAGCDIFTGKCNKVGVKVKYVCKFVTNESWSRGLDTSGKEVTSTKCPCPTCCSTSTGKCTGSNTPTLKPICTFGTKRCSGNDLQQCVSNSWKLVENCRYGCDIANKKCKSAPLTPTPIKVNGRCGTKKYECAVGSIGNSVGENSQYYMWKCMGVNGGLKVDCSVKKEIKCNNYTYGSWSTCSSSGRQTRLVIGKTPYGCTGTPNATQIIYRTCTPLVLPTNGRCGTTRNSCSSGSFSDVTDSSISYLWRCLGKNGGISVSCSVKRASSGYTR